MNEGVEQIKSASYQDVSIRKIAEEMDRTVVFCGAGISRNSGIPIVSEFTTLMLLTLCSPAGKRIDNLDRKRVWKFLRKKLKITDDILNKIIYKLPFEAFMSILGGSGLETETEPLYEIFEMGMPNSNHELLACLMKCGILKLIITTNFDRLLEAAMRKAQVENYQVLFRTGQFDRIEWDNGKKKIIHLHGSIYDKKDLASTIELVANRKMTEQRGRIIDYVFSGGPHSNVLVLGYSCSDVFDLSPCIMDIEDKSKTIIFIDHETGGLQTGDDKVDHAFRGFKSYERLKIHTDPFIKKLWEELEPRIKRKYASPVISQTLWKRSIFHWGVYHGPVRRHEILGKLFFLISEYEMAARNFKLVLEQQRSEFKHEALGSLGAAYHFLGKYDKAVRYYIQALDIVRENKQWALEGELLGKIGSIYSEQNRTRLAIDCYDQALNRGRDYGRKENVGRWLGLFALESGDHRSAMAHFGHALDASRDEGEKLMEETWLGYIGDTFLKSGDYLSAIDNYSDAVKIARQIDDERGEGMLLGRIGNAYCRSGDYLSAIENFELALVIADRIADLNTRGNCFAGLAEANQKLGRYDIAVKYNRKALKIARFRKDVIAEVNCLTELGNAYQGLTCHNAAVRYHKNALTRLKKWFGHDHPSTKSAELSLDMAIQKRNSKWKF